MFVYDFDARDFISTLADDSVDLLLTDPPYCGITKDAWDNVWDSPEAFVNWLYRIFADCRPKLKETGSLVFFGGIGKHGQRPLLDLIDRLDHSGLYIYRNWITWAKRRAYGKKNDYLFTREEILWYTVSNRFCFNIPLLDQKRGYSGFNPKYPAKSEYKRVTNVWTDIPELMRPARSCQKPEPLMARLVATHSNPGNLVVDPFAGYGTTGIAAVKLNRLFLGSEKITADAQAADARVAHAYETRDPNTTITFGREYVIAEK